MISRLKNIRFVRVDQEPAEGLDHLPDKLWPFIWFFLKQGKWPFLAISICYIISTTLFSLTPYFVKLFVDTLTTIENKETFWDDIFWIAFGYVFLCGFMQSIFWRLANIMSALTHSDFANMVRRQLASYMSSHSIQYFQDDFAGRLSSKVMETPYAVRNTIAIAIEGFLYNFVTFIVAFILLAQTGLEQLTIMMAVAIFYFLIIRYYLPRLKEYSKEASDRMSKTRGQHVDIISNILSIKVFARDNFEQDRFLKTLNYNTEGYREKSFELYKFQAKLDIIMKSIWILPPAYALYAWSKGEATTGDVAMILTLSTQLGGTMWTFSFSLSDFFENLGMVHEGMETIVKPRLMKDKDGAERLALTPKKSSIAFKDVAFHYGKGSGVIDCLNLEIPAGQRIGLLGRSGAGKSTLVNLLLRFYDVEGGTIEVGGKNIKDVTQESLREHIAMVTQDPSLFHRSIRENIAYGKPDASEAEIIKAAKRARAHDFILDLVDKDGRTGYDAHVGERGVKLSGGQRQRVAIARVILKNAPILILDEATSALDSEVEEAIKEEMEQLMKGKTVIAIAHRLSTIRKMDRLIVLDAGAVVEDGSHQSLLRRKNGLYASLWQKQSGGFLLKD